MTFFVRNYTDSDFYPWVDFYTRISERSPLRRDFFAEYLICKFKRPGYNPLKDVCVAEHMGQIIAFADVVHEQRIKRAVFSGFVLSEFRRRGVGRALVGRLIRRSQELGAGLAHVNVPDSAKESSLFLANCGFGLIRSYNNMQLDVRNRQATAGNLTPAGVSHFVSGEEELLARLQNRIFEGSWGFCPNSTEDIRYYLDLTGCKIEDVLSLKTDDSLIGYSWFHVLPWKSTERKMRIHMFGVDPVFRGKGWGNRLLQTTVKRIYEAGAKTIELTVDSENIPAVSLYESLGFSLRNISFWYEKTI